jgi:hypothetical protein
MPEREAWREPVQELKSLLPAVAETVVYGLIKHGSSVTEAVFGESLSHDWPPRPGVRRTWPLTCARAFESSLAPDAFALQLLGPGYAGRLQPGSSWRQHNVASDTVVLEHTQPEAWFNVEFVPYGPGMRTAIGVSEPAVLAQARREFAEILLR